MQIQFFAFNKRERSTKRPEASYSPILLDVQLKDRTSLLNPVFIFDFEPITGNYIYVPTWNRYYFVTGFEYIEGLWYVACKLDVLATYKNEIKNTDCMIIYHSNGADDIVDNRIPVKSGVTVSKSSKSLSGINWLLSGAGTPILTITGKGSNGIYAINFSDISELLDGLDTWYNMNIPDVWTAVKQLAYGGSAAENIKGAFALPFTVASGGVSENIYLGGYPCLDGNGSAISGYRLIQYNQDASCNITIPWQYADWRKSSPYSSVRMFLPLCGLFTLNNEDIKNDSSLDVNYTFNRSSGDFSVTVKGHTSGNTVITSSGNCAMGLFIGSSGPDIGKIITGNASAGAVVGGGIAALALGATGAAAVGAIAAIGGGLAAGASATLEGLGGPTEGIGGLSGGAAINMGTDVVIFVESKTLADTPVNVASKIGKPVYKKGIASTYGDGYFQADGFQFEDVHATESEIIEINNLVNTGIYLE